MSRLSPLAFNILILTAGFSLGWIMGLSTSPIAATVVSLTLGLVTSAAALVPNKEGDKKDHVRTDSIMIATLLLIGAAGGSAVGIYVRTSSLLSPMPLRLSGDLEAAKKIYLPDYENTYAGRILDSYFPPLRASNQQGSASTSTSQSGSVLYNGFSEGECSELLTAISTPTILRERMRSSPEKKIRATEAAISDNASLVRTIKEVLCTP